MVFPFTFTSMLPYPFSTPDQPAQSTQPASAEPIPSHWHNIVNAAAEQAAATSIQATPTRQRLPKVPRRVFDDFDSAPAPLQRKRGWEPAAPTTLAEAATTSRSALGRFDTQAEYLHHANSARRDHDGYLEREQEHASPPAPKRRRLGETIFETALNVALVGTAVGLTAFRLWRDRGKLSEIDASQVPQRSEPPPPPYERVPVYAPIPALPPRAPSPTPTASDSGRSSQYRKPARPIRASPRKKAITTRHSRAPTARASTNTLRSSAFDRDLSHKRSTMTMAEQLPADDDDDDGVEDEMDWMSAKLRGLIEQGQKALGKEIVVMDDSTYDHEQGVEDDGSYDWEDDDREHAPISRARSIASLASRPGLSGPVSSRDVHVPTTSPYRLGTNANVSSSSIASTSYVARSNSVTPSRPVISKAQAPPSSWSASRARSYTTSTDTTGSYAPHALRHSPSTSFDTTPTKSSSSSSAPMAVPRRMTSSATLSRPSDEERFWADPKSQMPGPGEDDGLSGSPEMRHFMEEARRARFGR